MLSPGSCLGSSMTQGLWDASEYSGCGGQSSVPQRCLHRTPELVWTKALHTSDYRKDFKLRRLTWVFQWPNVITRVNKNNGKREVEG